MSFSDYLFDISDINFVKLSRLALCEFLATGHLILFEILAAGNAFSGVANLSLCIWFALPFSGGHLNPWVSLLMALKQNISVLTCLIYIIAQILGATLASFFAIFLLNSIASFRNLPNKDSIGMLVISATDQYGNKLYGPALMLEILASFMFYLTVLSVTDEFRASASTGLPSFLAAFLIGFTRLAVAPICKDITAGCLNPVRSLGPAIVSLNFDYQWVFLLGSLLGALLALLIYSLVYDPFLSRKRLEDYCLYKKPKNDPAIKKSNSFVSFDLKKDYES